MLKISMLFIITCGGYGACGVACFPPQSNLDHIAVVVEHTCGDQLLWPLNYYHRNLAW